MTICEQLETSVAESCDVLVCGGGIAGIAAACAAARSGKKVILTEREYMLGGLATAGLVAIYLPLCDGYGRQVSFGLAEELLKLSVSVWHDEKRGYPNWVGDPENSVRDGKTPRYEVNFNPQLFAIQAEQLLLQAGVQILYGTAAVAAATAGDTMQAVVFENKSGRFAIQAGSFVDATGDADLAKFAGLPTALFGAGNVLSYWYYSTSEKDSYQLHLAGEQDIMGVNVQPGDRRYTGLDGTEISQIMCRSHGRILEDVLERRKEQPEYQPTTIATIPQLRMTRRICGEYTQDISEAHTRFEDSIGLVSNWHRRGPVYEVPFRTLYNRNMRNLLFAGRITSSTDIMWDIMRVIPCCAVTGEAAGVAAAMSNDMPALDVAALQRELRRRGVVIHEKDEIA